MNDRANNWMKLYIFSFHTTFQCRFQNSLVQYVQWPRGKAMWSWLAQLETLSCRALCQGTSHPLLRYDPTQQAQQTLLLCIISDSNQALQIVARFCALYYNNLPPRQSVSGCRRWEERNCWEQLWSQPEASVYHRFRLLRADCSISESFCLSWFFVGSHWWALGTGHPCLKTSVLDLWAWQACHSLGCCGSPSRLGQNNRGKHAHYISIFLTEIHLEHVYFLHEINSDIKLSQSRCYVSI